MNLLLGRKVMKECIKVESEIILESIFYKIIKISYEALY